MKTSLFDKTVAVAVVAATCLALAALWSPRLQSARRIVPAPMSVPAAPAAGPLLLQLDEASDCAGTQPRGGEAGAPVTRLPSPLPGRPRGIWL